MRTILVALLLATGTGSASAEPMLTERQCQLGAVRADGFDVCADQQALLDAAIERARVGRKLLLVEVMASWCPDCRALQRMLPAATLFGDPSLAARMERVEIVTSTVAAGKVTSVPSGEAAFAQILPAESGRAAMRGWPFLIMIDPAQPARAVGLNTDRLHRDGAIDATRLRDALLAMATAAAGQTAPPDDKPPSVVEKALMKIFGG
jgi:thiol-disulfide isomerase/thioredoxin